MDKKENRQLEILIDNVPFRVDSKKGQIIEVGNPENYIKKQDLIDEGSWYRTIYDKTTRNIFKNRLESGVANFRVVPLSIPKTLFNRTLVSDESLIKQFRLDCRTACRGFEVVGSKQIIQNNERPKVKAKSKSVARKKRSR